MRKQKTAKEELKTRLTIISWFSDCVKYDEKTASVELKTKQGTVVKFDESNMTMDGSLSWSQMTEIGNAMQALERKRQEAVIGGAISQGLL